MTLVRQQVAVPAVAVAVAVIIAVDIIADFVQWPATSDWSRVDLG